MAALAVNKAGRYFEKNGKPFFLLADTVWSAFTNIREEEWKEYLSVRKSQGFNGIQINCLPQWDRGESSLNLLPYALKEDGSWDYDSVNEAYFDHAEKLCAMAKEAGFELELVLLWCNYVPGTWANAFQKHSTIPEERLDEVLNLLLDRFEKYEPVYFIGGDTDFPEEDTVRYYRRAFDLLEERGSSGLKTIHIKGRFTDVPDELYRRMDFAMYQSGHNIDGQADAWKNGEVMYEKGEKPVINGEPCYEEMGYSHCLYGRFGQNDIRKAAWQSVLSGASAGITYGAHGIWNWVSKGMKTNLAPGEGFLPPMPKEAALGFPGARDYGFIHELFDRYDLYGMKPAQEMIDLPYEEIRASKKDELMAVYMPYNVSLKLKGSGWKEVLRIDLLTKETEKAEWKETENGMIIPMHECLGDVLYLIYC